MQVHRYFGVGYTELIYQRSLLVELVNLGLQVEKEVEREVFYKEVLVGKRRLDILVEGKVLLEIKAIQILDEACESQLLNYLKVFDIRLGLLLNFGSKKLQHKRYIH